MLLVLQTSSVAAFIHRIKQYDDQLELQQFQIIDRLNSTKVFDAVFKFAWDIHTEMCTLRTWQEALISQPKLFLATIFWKNRC